VRPGALVREVVPLGASYSPAGAPPRCTAPRLRLPRTFSPLRVVPGQMRPAQGTIGRPRLKTLASIAWFAALLLAGCASGPPTIKLDAKAFVQSYMKERDAFVRATGPAHRKCEATKAVAAEALKLKCEKLMEREAEWQARDAAILEAILTRSAIDATTWAAVWTVAERVLVIAADIAL